MIQGNAISGKQTYVLRVIHWKPATTRILIICKDNTRIQNTTNPTYVFYQDNFHSIYARLKPCG